VLLMAAIAYHLLQQAIISHPRRGVNLEGRLPCLAG
jgi:hypothetical protein